MRELEIFSVVVVVTRVHAFDKTYELDIYNGWVLLHVKYNSKLIFRKMRSKKNIAFIKTLSMAET